jgi:hypothetical protein
MQYKASEIFTTFGQGSNSLTGSFGFGASFRLNQLINDFVEDVDYLGGMILGSYWGRLISPFSALSRVSENISSFFAVLLPFTNYSDWWCSSSPSSSGN